MDDRVGPSDLTLVAVDPDDTLKLKLEILEYGVLRDSGKDTAPAGCIDTPGILARVGRRRVLSAAGSRSPGLACVDFMVGFTDSKSLFRATASRKQLS